MHDLYNLWKGTDISMLDDKRYFLPHLYLLSQRTTMFLIKHISGIYIVDWSLTRLLKNSPYYRPVSCMLTSVIWIPLGSPVVPLENSIKVTCLLVSLGS